MSAEPISIWPLAGFPEVAPGHDLVALAVDAVREGGLAPRDGDILVFTSKIVAKAQGRFVALASFEPGAKARELAALTGKDPRLVEAILSETREVVRTSPHVIIVETHGGFILANAGIDQSNLAAHDQGQRVLLLPEDPDGIAAQFKARLDEHFGCHLGVVISDSVGRPWRLGTVGIAIGAAGIASLWDRRGEPDRMGRRLEVTEVAFADAVASAAVLAMGEGAEGRPAALLRGFKTTAAARPAAALLRPKHMDLFR
ncbi:MAG: coenzyme F420-0:L-glutamate ligase [Hyphomicrobiales bacterium]|nr:MAG: coenzyme F420-0:L-glutamate ligase [Hyphomicrobiales bacterium]